jgi:hypothetical protein
MSTVIQAPGLIAPSNPPSGAYELLPAPAAMQGVSTEPDSTCIGCRRELPRDRADAINHLVLAVQSWEDDGGASSPCCPCERW